VRCVGCPREVARAPAGEPDPPARVRGGALGVALGAAVAVLGCHGRSVERAPRSLDARLSLDAAWRPPGGGAERLSLDQQAALEGNPLALAEAQLRARDLTAAEAALTRVPSTREAENDRAVLDLQRGHAGEALARLPSGREGAAAWNRALALAALGLDLDAARAFSEVAAAGETGWSVEAAFRAEQLRQRVQLGRAAQRRIQQAGVALLLEGTLPDDELVRRYASPVRYYFNHAVRSATTADQVRALEPLARALDAQSGGDVLRRAVESAAARDFTVRAPLAREYRRLNPGAGTPKENEAFLTALRRAGQDDILVLALIVLRTARLDLDELDRLARASGDPWFRAIDDGKRAETLGDPDAAALLRQSLDRCRAARMPYRCVPLASQLVGVLIRLHRTAEADRIGRAALADAHDGLPSPSVELLFRLADVARLRLDSPMMRAFLEEGALRSPRDCVVQRASHEMMAQDRVLAFDAAGAAADLARAPRCDQPITLLRADMLAELARQGVSVDEQARLAADLDAARPQLGAGERAQADVVLGRYLVTRDPPAGRAALERGVRAADALPADDVDARKAAYYGRLSQAVEAMARGAADDSLDALAQLSGASASACSVGLAVDGAQLLRVARGPTGAAQGRLTRLDSPALAPASWADDQLQRAIDGCSEVAVFAAAPIHGIPRILPPTVAWSYRGPVRAHPPPPGQPRRLVVADVIPAPELGLPRLQPYVERDLDRAPGATVLRGPGATPARVLEAMAGATEVELHTHGLVDLERSDASLLVLSPGPDGRTALTAGEIRARPLAGAPVVTLGACRAARVATWLHDPWSLPEAFLAAGARAVFGSPEPIPDAAATSFFAGVTARIRAGESPARALRDERMKWRPHDGWVDDVLVFE
jgi:hypothetical protein